MLQATVKGSHWRKNKVIEALKSRPAAKQNE
jgi:hypothetical protein